jgi:site-specific DNA recombinase
MVISATAPCRLESKLDSLSAPDYILQNFEASDRIAVLVRSRKAGETIQRITTATNAASHDFQAWLRHKNVSSDVYLGMNTLRHDAQSRTKEDIAAIRHLYLAKKTHRGMDGSMLRGRHTGGRIFGYDNVSLGDDQGVVLALNLNDSEAAIVRRIFQMSADGVSLKKIAGTLNQEHVPTPRPQARNGWATWCHSAVREMLYRELYIGRVIWNRSKFIRVPGTNKRVRRMRPESEWRVAQRQELRIIDQALWERVNTRFQAFKDSYHAKKRPGLLPRSETSKFLFSGLLKCGQCGGNLAIVAGGGKEQYRKYGCSQHWYRGACSNNLLERQIWLEKRLLADLQTEILKPEALEYTIAQFGDQLKTTLGRLSGELAQMRKRKRAIEVELRRLTETAALTGPSTFLIQAINEREQELRQITDKLLSTGPESI